MISRTILSVLVVSVFLLPASSSAEQERCPDIWEPVCGYDRQTYANGCFAEQANVGIAYQGECLKCGGIAGLECPKSLVCDLEPGMCGVKDAPGDCIPPPGDICTADYKPVCDCDGKIHSNDCERLKAGAQKDYNGECVTGARAE